MYHGSPAIDRIGSSCSSASDLRQPRSPRPRRRGRVTAASVVADDADADEELLLHPRLEPAYVVQHVNDRVREHGTGWCHAAPRPGRRRNAGNAIRILLLATAAAFLALAVSPVSGTANKKEEETAVATVGITEESTGGSVLGTKSRTGTDPGGGIDLLAALQLHNTTRQGVTQVPGLVRLKPAYYLQGEERELRLNEASFERAATLLRRVPEFTIAAALRQEEANSGTIVAFSHGNNRYLELQSSGRKDELRLHYVSRRDGSVHVEAFPFRLADGAWHRVALSVSGSQVELLVDCHPLYRRLLRPGPPDTNFTLPQLQLWVGQRNVRHFLFKGALQDVKLIPGPHGYLSQCPQLDSSCPTCGQFSILQNTVEQLMHNLNELTRRLAAAEGRISKVEECECQKSCRANGTVHEDGATWEKGCQQCSCVHGEIECRPTPCAPATCKNPVIPQGQCCPICLKQCYLHGVMYDHGEKVSPKQCVECKCFDGSFTCKRFDTETRCPPLPCPPSEQISVAEECCKFCPGVDYCAKGHKCHANASCLNLQTTYACHCDIGFQGDGHNCHDVDECKQQGGSEGHHCNANTKCVNVIGSYTCECLPGYHRVDKFNCAELDECATGHHACDEHATCVNTAGSYYCICKDGYTGDGYACKPVCNQTCQNGGECVAPGKCSCRRGYIGNSCELDLDECASDLHRCHQSSTCFNMPGWYYCRCKPGYRSALHDSTQGTQCLDIDECNDQTIERRHTCHPTANCVNTEGGYECVCPPQEDNHTMVECRLSCWFENRELKNGETLAPAGNPCRRCTCKDGVITCRDPICDCSAPGSHRDKCCPQCDPAASCRHQELHHLVFRSGERWIYQCQTCECLYGEIDCWQMECPPVTCSNPVTEDGDCCPRCEDDPCARELPGNGTSLSILTRPRPCSYSGIIHDSGSSWQDPHDKCTTCECKVPYCAQLVSNSACCVHRTGSYAAATITAALAIWAATSTSNVLQSLFLSLSLAVYRILRGQRWLTVHRKQLYQRLPLPAAPAAHRSPPPTSCQPRLLPPSPRAVPPPGRDTGTPCRTPCQGRLNNSSRGTTVAEHSCKLYLQPGTSCPPDQRRRRRRHLNALHLRRRRRTTAKAPIKHEAASRRRAKPTNNASISNRNASSSASSSSSPPFAILPSASSPDPRADRISTTSSSGNASENVTNNNNYRQGGRNRRSGEPVAAT
ncbi:LOW QUALITY PROTEIN: protein kinase C-binding protein NELL1-like [Ceratina calcarata]|uniref:LOW QUALITY PROTEIN: protein kinase C-binding protein NELL1-like n=1 Tax=Ceratina calcarata TaxID=156304 RepID=A0AAJ7JHB8_9HYME|nr:LOW QUALITY PROTEIN: protein kinase C-binding protein NELL1-like [Ceratina calcarata]